MKKHLIAAAVATVVAAPAMAQNVTLSGLLDTGIVARDSGNSTGGSFTGATSNVLTTSNIAIRASEDLGGGMKVAVTIFDEIQLHNNRAATVAAGSDTLTNTNGAFASVDQYSLAISGAFGTFEGGRFPSMARSVNGAGSVIGNIGLPGNYGANVAVTAVNQVGAIAAGDNMSMRVLGNYANNSYAYTTPLFNGIQAQFYRTAANTATGKAGELDGVALRYTNGPLVLGYSTIKQTTTAAGAKRETVAFSAQYDAGFARFGAATLDHDESSATAGEDGKVSMITATAPIGGGLNVFGGYHVFEDRAATTNNGGKAMMVGVSKDLSKRTTIYAAHAKVTNETNSSYNLSVMDTGIATVGNDPSATVIGLRHSF